MVYADIVEKERSCLVTQFFVMKTCGGAADDGDLKNALLEALR